MKSKKCWALGLSLALVASLGAAAVSVSAAPAAEDWAKNEVGGAVTTVTALENGWKLSSELPAAQGGTNAESTAVLQLPLNLEQPLSFDMKIDYNRTSVEDTSPNRGFVMAINGADITDTANGQYFSQFNLKAINPNVTGFQVRFTSESAWLSSGAPEATNVTMFYENANGTGGSQNGNGGNWTGTAGDTTLKISDMLYEEQTVRVTVDKADDAYQLRFNGVGTITGGWGPAELTFDIPVESAGYKADQTVQLAFSFLNWNCTTATTMGVEVTNFSNAAYSMAFDSSSYVLDEIGKTLDLSEELTITDLAADAPADVDVTWTSSDAAVAEVSDAGVVTAKKAGTATVTAALADGTKATCTVDVRIPAAGWTFAENSYLAAYEAEDGTRIAGEIPAPASGQSATLQDMAVITQRMKPASKLSFDLAVNYDGAEANRWLAICFNRAAVTDGVPSLEDMNVSAIGGLKQSGFQITLDAAPSWAGVYTAVNVVTYGYKGQYGGATLPSTDTVNSELAQNFWAGAPIHVEITRTETAYVVTLDDQTLTIPHSELSAEGDFSAADQVFLGFKMFNGTDTAASVDFTVSNLENGLMSGVTLDKTEVALSKDNPSAALKATIQWKEGVDHSSADETITWLTSDFSVVSVENGVLTAKKAGTATITAMTAEGDTATCTVTVTWNDGGSTTDPGDGDGDNNGDGQEPADNGGCSGAMGIGAGVAALSVVSLAACAAAVSAKKKANK